MVEIRIDVSDLRREDTEKVKEFTDFLEDKLGVNTKVEGNAITLSGDSFSKKYLRFLVRKFLYRSGLRERFRMISNGESMKIKRRKNI